MGWGMIAAYRYLLLTPDIFHQFQQKCHRTNSTYTHYLIQLSQIGLNPLLAKCPALCYLSIMSVHSGICKGLYHSAHPLGVESESMLIIMFCGLMDSEKERVFCGVVCAYGGKVVAHNWRVLPIKKSIMPIDPMTPLGDPLIKWKAFSTIYNENLSTYGDNLVHAQ